MDEVVAANRQGIAVAHNGDDFHLRAGNFQAGGKRQGAAMRGVQGVVVHIHRHPGGTTDPGHQRHLIVLQTQAFNGTDQGTHHHANPAASAPDGRKPFVFAQMLQGRARFEPVLARNLALVDIQIMHRKNMFTHPLNPPPHSQPFQA